ncbi:hypothetical protein LRH25_13680 [Ideonella azotifigens]|uniref:DUF1795 domain-containing protein n=1 Tax=Ideonella azotifigens TaxID=513160 RepID=A0ABP3V8A3_9BURK|nr:hypothetical protein [Ideonella azotifigens]MCD2341393.1 hypothetical protein [Ideonella azotifigens]
MLTLLAVGGVTVSCAPPLDEKLRAAGVSFTVPANWTEQSFPGSSGVQIMCPPIAGGYDAYLFIEQLSRTEPQSPDDYLANLSNRRKANTVGYEERRRREGRNVHGVVYGLLEYFHVLNRIPSVEWAAVLPRTRLSNVYVYGCTTAATAERHLAIFYEFLNSIALAPSQAP